RSGWIPVRAKKASHCERSCTIAINRKQIRSPSQMASPFARCVDRWKKMLASAICRSLAGGVTRAAAKGGHEDDAQISQKCTRFQITPVNLSQMLRSGHVDRSELGDAGDPGADIEHIARTPRSDDLGLIGKTGPRADQAHVSAQHVEQLRELVEFQRAQAP